MTVATVIRWLDQTLLDLARQVRWSFLPPLMVYLAAGVSGLTAIVGTFFIKEYLDLSAAFLAGLNAFWAGIPWALKMPIGHLVDLIWRWKAVLVYLGALPHRIQHRRHVSPSSPTPGQMIRGHGRIESLVRGERPSRADVGYVVQDVVADAMTVEAVPLVDDAWQALSRQPTMKADAHHDADHGSVCHHFSGLILVAALEHLSCSRASRPRCRRPRQTRPFTRTST